MANMLRSKKNILDSLAKAFSPKKFNLKNLNKLILIQKNRLKLFETLRLNAISLKNYKKNKFFFKRETTRDYSKKELPFEDFSSILVNSFGIRSSKLKMKYSLKKRTYPSAGGLNSVDIFIYVNNVEGLKNGFYLFNPYNYELFLLSLENSIEPYFPYSNNVEIKNCSFFVFFMTDLNPLILKYGYRGYKYALIEVGHMAQNLCLFSEQIGFGSVCLGAFNEKKLSKKINKYMKTSIEYCVAVGKKKK